MSTLMYCIGETDDAIKPGIYKNYAALAAKFEPKGEVLLKLFEANIFTDAECEALNDSSDDDRGRDFLQLLLRKPNPDAGGAFLNCLMNEPLTWMANLIIGVKSSKSNVILKVKCEYNYLNGFIVLRIFHLDLDNYFNSFTSLN